MIDDELRQAARDLRRHTDRLQPPPLEPSGSKMVGRLAIVAASIGVFLLGVLFVADLADQRNGDDADRQETADVVDRQDDADGDQSDVETAPVTDDDESPSDNTSTDADGSGDADSDSETIEADGEADFGPTDGYRSLDSIGDTTHRPASTLTRPTPDVGWVAEAEFGTAVSAVTEVAAGESVSPVPGSIAAWNADGSLLLTYERTADVWGHALYDGRDFTFIRRVGFEPADIEQVFWSPTDPDVLLYPSGNRLMAYSARDDRSTVAHRFDECDTVDVFRMAQPISDDGRVVGLRCQTPAGQTMVAVDLESAAVASAELEGIGPVPTPDGRRFVTQGEDGTIRVLDQDLAPTGVQFQVGSDAFVLISTDDGRQLLVTTVFSQPVDAIGSIVAFDLADGQAAVAVGQASGFPYPPSGTTLSTAVIDGGLVAAAIVGERNPTAQDTLDGELLLVDFNPSTPVVHRVGHHRGTTDSPDVDPYWSLPRPAIDPASPRLLVSSDWGGDRVDLFLIDLTGDPPANQPGSADD